ncbi:hypothetical protein ALQ79_200172 [Pseudomonas amygdali pv. lachrymans]|nr:hypothetical protein ALQ79_200172 [Pseudomonas amygdali pv. lachrymans]
MRALLPRVSGKSSLLPSARAAQSFQILAQACRPQTVHTPGRYGDPIPAASGKDKPFLAVRTFNDDQEDFNHALRRHVDYHIYERPDGPQRPCRDAGDQCELVRQRHR